MKTACQAALVAAALLLLPLQSFAQKPIQPQQADTLDKDVRLDLTLSAIWKVSDKVAIDLAYTMLTKDNISEIFRNQISLGASYSPWKPLKLGVGYMYIAQYSNSGALRPKHKVYCSAGGYLDVGGWKLGLATKFLFTHNAYDINVYSKVRNDLDLRTTLSGAYTTLEHLEPYAYVELWNCFNDPSFYAEYDAETQTYSNYQFIDYNNAYITRIRACIGLKWKINPHHCIDISYKFDYSQRKDIDIDKAGTTLEAYRWDNSILSHISFGYAFSF